MAAETCLWLGLGREEEAAIARQAAGAAGLEVRPWAAHVSSPGSYLLDSAGPGPNAYEVALRLRRQPGVRVCLLADLERQKEAGELARIVGASLLLRPLEERRLAEVLAGGKSWERPRVERLLDDLEGQVDPEVLAAKVLKGLTPGTDPEKTLIQVLTEAETGLFTAVYMGFRLEEEVKRAYRFLLPLTVALVDLVAPPGWTRDVPLSAVLEVSGRLLGETRDIDCLGHWEGSAFMLLLPGTPLAGAEAMLRRIFAAAGPLEGELQGWRLASGLVVAQDPPTLPGRELLEQAEAALDAARRDPGKGFLSLRLAGQA